MKMDELIETIARAYQNPRPGEADKNGHTRLSVLKESFHMSSLKIQKILVTAGVYEPVKDGTSYEEITRLREEGKTAGEIQKILGLSSAAVSACFPYERAVYHAEQNGVQISPDAIRKRKQRGKEDMKRRNARVNLKDHMSDDLFWKAVCEHDQETFISTTGERFRIDAQYTDVPKQILQVYRETGGAISLSREEVLDIFHDALELKAAKGDISASSFKKTRALPYIYPLLVIFGIVPGNLRRSMVRRDLPEDSVCSCCGRGADYMVSTYADLVHIAAEIEERERSRWDPLERERVEREEDSLGRIGWDKIAKYDNAAIRAFDMEGERSLCTLCAQTIRMALSDDSLPQSSAPEDFSNLSLEVAKTACHKYLKEFPEGIVYKDRYDRKYIYGMFKEDVWRCLLLKEKDREGITHSFACYVQDFGSHMVFDAMEIHKLTKAGKYSRDYTGTDYEFTTGFWILDDIDESEVSRKTYTTFLELINRIRHALHNPTLKWHDRFPFISNAVEIGKRQCTLRSVGEMKVVYVDDAVVQGREWDGGTHGYLIDGIIFTGEEVARMSSTHEGWNLQYRFADPGDQPLKQGDYLMPVQLGDKELVTELSQLLNLFTSDGRFISEHDQENFGILFDRTFLKKLKLYHKSNPRGYGKLAGMQITKRLKWIKNTERYIEQVQDIVQI